jgi:hypothetical protein
VIDASANSLEEVAGSYAWPTIRDALEGFVLSSSHDGASAALTFFPHAEAATPTAIDCSADGYTVADLAMTALPSEQFGEPLAVAGAKSWTAKEIPELAAVSGALETLEASDAARGKALILISAGLLHGCGVESVPDEHPTNLPVYVIGVGDWPLDALDGPWSFARWGASRGTNTAYAANVHELRTALEKFWLASAQCRLRADGAVCPDSVLSVHEETGTQVDLSYDAECTTALGWFLVDDGFETLLELCPETCAQLATLYASGMPNITAQGYCD